MTNELVIPQVESSLATTPQEVYDELSKGGDYLPYLTLCNGSTKLVTEGKMNVGKYAIVYNKSTFKDLGPSVVAWILAKRPKAADFSKQNPISYYDYKSKEFEEVKARSAIQNSNCCYGTEFLLYLNSKEFVTYHMSSVSARMISKTVMGLLEMKKPMVLSGVIAKNEKNTWWNPVVNESTIRPDQPDEEKFKIELTKFLNPKSSVVEVADKAQTAPGREQ